MLSRSQPDEVKDRVSSRGTIPECFPTAKTFVQFWYLRCNSKFFTICLGSFSAAVVTYPDRSPVREKALFKLILPGCSPSIAEKSQWQDLEAGNHTMPTVKKPSSFYTILDPSQKMVPPIGGQVSWHLSLKYQDILPTADRARGLCQGDSRACQVDN